MGIKGTCYHLADERKVRLEEYKQIPRPKVETKPSQSPQLQGCIVIRNSLKWHQLSQDDKEAIMVIKEKTPTIRNWI